jgi:hypothetical protein
MKLVFVRMARAEGLKGLGFVQGLKPFRVGAAPAARLKPCPATSCFSERVLLQRLRARSFQAALAGVAAVAVLYGGVSGGLCSAQTTAPQPAAQQDQQRNQQQDQQQNQQQDQQQNQQQQPAGKVIFSRSIDENGQTTTSTGPGADQAAGTIAKAPIANDAERQAVTFTAYDLDVHLHPQDRRIAVRALITVRNDGQSPLAHIPLQISSSLNWERIHMGGRDVAYEVATLNSDADHTGQLHEAAVTLDRPLAPGASLELSVTYSGVIAPSAQRLVAIGTPDDVALHSDWDAVDADFTGLRGFGNVVWYPVSSVPAILGISQAAATLAWQKAGAADVDSARLFDEMGEQKLRTEGAQFALRLADEIPLGHAAPTIVLINGHAAPVAVTAGSGEVAGVATASVRGSRLGFQAPSLFVAVRKQEQAANATLWALDRDEAAVPAWDAAASAVMPFLTRWLGPHPRSQLTILDLPDPEDAPFESGAMLAAPIRQGTEDQLDGILVHALSRAFLHADSQSPPAWLDEGVAQFMSTLWLEKQSGRTKALESLEADRAALALAEPSSPGESSGQPLGRAISPVYYRTKAAYVLWMLRDIAGDDALAAALRAYDAEQDTSKSGEPGEFEKLLEENAHRDLKWFFADWVDADKGLPDLTIDSIFPAAAQGGNTLVVVNVSNAGYAAAEIPVTVRTTETSITQRLLVPARGKALRRILIQGRLTMVEANDGTVPETEASIHVTHLTDAGLPSGERSAPR